MLLISLFFIICCFCTLAVLTLNLFQTGGNSTKFVKHDEMKNSVPIPNQQTPVSDSFANRVKREIIMPSDHVNGPEMHKNRQQMQSVPVVTNFQQIPSSNYLQLETRNYAYSIPTFIPIQYQPQRQYGQQQAFPVQFPVDSNRQTTQSIHRSTYHSTLPNTIDTGTLFCTLLPVVSTYPMPTLKDSSNYNVIHTGQLFYNPPNSHFKEFVQRCPTGFYRCNDGAKCVSKLKWCDNNIDCLDASDETACTCKDRISREKRCDNYNDCPQSDDELGCFGCPNNSLSCHDSSGNCISPQERCNGSPLCKNNKDEMDCCILTKSYTYANEVDSVGSHVGFLQKNFQSKWYPVCGYAYAWAKDACISELGFLSGDIEFELVNIPRQSEMGPYLTTNGYTNKLIAECPDGLAYVRCPLSNDSHFDQPSSSNGPYEFDSEQANSTSNDPSYDPILGIVGGHSSLPLSWPFIIAINKNGQFHCGGVILTEYWILSAAHCFNSYKKQYYDIDAGVLRRFSYSPTRQTRYLIGLVIHQHYNTLTLQNDIALCLLNEPLYFNIWVRPVRLPDMYSNFFTRRNQAPYPGQRCVAVGWGATREGGSNLDQLQEVEVEIINCTQPTDKTEAEICAGHREGGRDACQGDSGGPLMCRSSDWSYDWYVGGIVSHGVGCGRRNQPGAYTRVSHFRDWINSILYNRNANPEFIQQISSSCPGFNCNKLHPKCLPGKQRCDGIVNCLGAEDETNCPNLNARKLLDRRQRTPTHS